MGKWDDEDDEIQETVLNRHIPIPEKKIEPKMADRIVEPKPRLQPKPIIQEVNPFSSLDPDYAELIMRNWEKVYASNISRFRNKQATGMMGFVEDLNKFLTHKVFPLLPKTPTEHEKVFLDVLSNNSNQE